MNGFPVQEGSFFREDNRTTDYNLVASNWHGMGKAVVTVQKLSKLPFG